MPSPLEYAMMPQGVTEDGSAPINIGEAELIARFMEDPAFRAKFLAGETPDLLPLLTKSKPGSQNLTKANPLMQLLSQNVSGVSPQNPPYTKMSVSGPNAIGAGFNGQPPPRIPPSTIEGMTEEDLGGGIPIPGSKPVFNVPLPKAKPTQASAPEGLGGLKSVVEALRASGLLPELPQKRDYPSGQMTPSDIIKNNWPWMLLNSGAATLANSDKSTGVAIGRGLQTGLGAGLELEASNVKERQNAFEKNFAQEAKLAGLKQNEVNTALEYAKMMRKAGVDAQEATLKGIQVQTAQINLDRLKENNPEQSKIIGAVTDLMKNMMKDNPQLPLEDLSKAVSTFMTALKTMSGMKSDKPLIGNTK